MILVVGLGNPGPRYVGTRHNSGYLVVDRLAGEATWRARFHGQLAEIELGSERVGLLKPETYMNESGRSVRPAAAYLGVPTSDLLVVHDELDLPFGTIRLKNGGGDAGHNGLKSIRSHLKTGDFCRLRIGVGRPPPDFGGDVADYVLQAFASAERADLDSVVDRAADAVALVVRSGLAEAMKVTNQRT